MQPEERLAAIRARLAESQTDQYALTTLTIAKHACDDLRFLLTQLDATEKSAEFSEGSYRQAAGEREVVRRERDAALAERDAAIQRAVTAERERDALRANEARLRLEYAHEQSLCRQAESGRLDRARQLQEAVSERDAARAEAARLCGLHHQHRQQQKRLIERLCRTRDATEDYDVRYAYQGAVREIQRAFTDDEPGAAAAEDEG